MARKKLQDMEPFERVLPRLKGLSNEEAEEVAIKILAQTTAKAIHVRGEGVDYLMGIMKRVCQEADKYTKEHSWDLALGKVFYDKRNEDDEEGL